MLDTSTEFGARVARRLRDEVGIWLVTVGADGTPQPNPVWFLWDGAEVLVYSQPNQAKLRHIARHPRVALHLEGGELSEEVAVLLGDARIVPDEPPANQVPAYMEKYRAHIARLGMTPESFAQSYSVAIRIRPTRVRGW
ncbi:MAG TPA: TIGR03667 family PPOX class F420-dependent oxidoreductase [Roseiflexaceae bacterium]|nr:TIGR03667 family PPOX class F420-dependent oxidoreductase [Roseiflexaceae bacterium]